MPDNFIKIGNGEIGGKAKGFLKLVEFISKQSDLKITFPKTAFITTSVFDKFSNGVFSNPDELFSILDDFKNPIIVRSSSLLEDQKDASFAGKYESVFVGNIGSDEVRCEEFLDAIKKVYESTYNPNAVAYRLKHGFADAEEKMAVIVQEVVGRKYKNYYLPAIAGVAFSQNGYCWNKEIAKSDGLVRLVFGLGTRAVGRGYVRLFSPKKPSMRPEGTEATGIQKCSQKKVDVVDLETNSIKTVHFRELISDGFNCYPGSQNMVSLRDGNFIFQPISNFWDPTHVPILTMDGALTSSWFGLNIPDTLSCLLKDLEIYFGTAVDIEFAINLEEDNTAKIYLLQARPLSEREDRKPVPIPEIDQKKIVFDVKKNLPTSYIENLDYLIYVDDVAYHSWPHSDKHSIARVIGKLNEALKDKDFALIGPGRWGSWNVELGVPVSYAEISNAKMLVEIARRRATYVPEVSFGSHFFQDLIEDHIAYLPVYPDEANEFFNEIFFEGPSMFSKILAEDYYRQFDGLIRVIKSSASAILNGEEGRAVVFSK